MRGHRCRATTTNSLISSLGPAVGEKTLKEPILGPTRGWTSGRASPQLIIRWPKSVPSETSVCQAFSVSGLRTPPESNNSFLYFFLPSRSLTRCRAVTNLRRLAKGGWSRVLQGRSTSPAGSPCLGRGAEFHSRRRHAVHH